MTKPGEVKMMVYVNQLERAIEETKGHVARAVAEAVRVEREACERIVFDSNDGEAHEIKREILRQLRERAK